MRAVIFFGVAPGFLKYNVVIFYHQHIHPGVASVNLLLDPANHTV